MLILAMDSSGPSASVAIWRDGRLLAETTRQTGQPHSVTLMPIVSELLDICGISAASLDAYACAIGPGSFTGIRIGVSAAKGMAYAAGKPAIGISSLEAMAWPYAACPGLIVCPVIDARNQRVYAAAWLEGQQVVPAANYLAADFVASLDSHPARFPGEMPPLGILLVGYQSEAFFQSCGKPVITGTCPAAASSALPRAAAIAELAEIRLEQGELGLPQLLMPQYLSASQAERKRSAAHD